MEELEKKLAAIEYEKKQLDKLQNELKKYEKWQSVNKGLSATCYERLGRELDCDVLNLIIADGIKVNIELLKKQIPSQINALNNLLK